MLFIQEESGVMGSVETAVRDPVFYRLHYYINEIFDEFKKTLTEYSVNSSEVKQDQIPTWLKLDFANVVVENVQVFTGDLVNEFHTFWQKSNIDVKGGMNFAQPGSLLVEYRHIQHSPFTYKIKVSRMIL